MTDCGVTEFVVEGATLAWLETLAWQTAHGQNIAPDMLGAEYRDSGDVRGRSGCATRCGRSLFPANCR
ncbi:MAG: hypothetical protein DDT37_01216 [Firmicutes bacterium]|nr:hypothetical protein [candidate division NPL-UPA2 bacterium]